MRRETESGQRDHRVAPPLRKPVVAGDDAAIVVFAIDDALIGSQRQRPAQRETLATRALLVQRHSRLLFGRENHVERSARRELHAVRSRREEIFDEIEPALAFALVFEVVVPVGRRFELRAGDDDLHERRRAIMTPHQVMGIASGEKRAQPQLD